jgi:hypothetical protein
MSKYSKPQAAALPDAPCPHPGCDAPIRHVYNRRTGVLTAYHGEVALISLELNAALPINDGAELHTLLHEITARGGEDYDQLVHLMGTATAYQVAELHMLGLA